MYLAIDASLSDSGIVLLNSESKPIILESVKSNRIGDLIKQRFQRYYNITEKIDFLLSPFIKDIKVIAIESYSYGSKGKSDQIHESGALIRDLLLGKTNKDCKIIEVSPMSLKKFILGTGKGQGKELIIKEVYKKYDMDINNNNIADAFVLAKIAELYYKMANKLDVSGYYSFQIEVVQALIKKNK